MLVLLSVISLHSESRNIDRKETLCLAKNIYWESRSAEIRDQIRVSTVTLNRANKSGKTICQEVYKPKQFSWTNGGEPKLTLHNKIEEEAWRLAVEIAILKLTGDDLGDAGNHTYFYSPKLANPSWAEYKIVVSTSEDFIFMSD